jgi:transposase
MNITAVGIDLAKNVFQVHAVDARGKVVLRKQLRRAQVAGFFSNMPPCLNWHGSLCERPPLGAYVRALRAHSASDGLAVRQVVRQDEQERCG